MHYNLRPTFRAIRYFETMTKTSFLELDKNPDMIVQFIYCCLMAHPENNFYMKYEYAVEFMNKHADDLMYSFKVEMDIMNQFKDELEYGDEQPNESNETSEESSPKEDKIVYLSSVIPLLVADCGLDINYVMDDMNYNDAELYIRSSIVRKREQLENDRFWTYLTILPQVDGKKLKSPKDLIEFTWEKNERVEEAKKKMEVDRQKLIDIGIIKENKEENS